MSRFLIHATPLAGLQLVQRRPLTDERGFLARVFCSQDLKEAGWQGPVAQINHTLTRQCGTVRGLHFQRPPHAEMKLVSCLRGEVWDVALDLRIGSPTFLKWHAVHLSPENGQALLIPPGFAHGFQTITPGVEMLYCHSEAFAAHAEGGLHAKDPLLAVRWPLPITELSARDTTHPFINPDFQGVRL
jgi:dTDP-4-dehydrorhamnose 3,5-epimerase